MRPSWVWRLRTGPRAACTCWGTFTIDGATQTVHVEETVVDGTGQFAGATGEVTFEGLDLLGIIGEGGYHGWWARPRG